MELSQSRGRVEEIYLPVGVFGSSLDWEPYGYRIHIIAWKTKKTFLFIASIVLKRRRSIEITLEIYLPQSGGCSGKVRIREISRVLLTWKLKRLDWDGKEIEKRGRLT